MRAWRFSEFGDIANFKLGDYDVPEAADEELLVKLNYAALNPADRLLVEGRYPGAGDLPLTVGRDGSGLVESAAPGSAFSTGDAVIVLRSEIGITRQGTLAEYVVVPERSLAPLPNRWSMEEGAAGTLVYLTAWKALVVQGGLQQGETVLVNGASGGVGLAAIHLAKALGAKVVALSRSETTRTRLRDIGADFAIDSSADDLEDQVRNALDGAGAHVLIENLGGAFLQKSINMANPRGRIMVIGLLTGATVELLMGTVLFKQVRIEGVHVGQFKPPEAAAAWQNIVATLEKAGVRPIVDRIFPMNEVQQAFAHLAGSHLGKILVDVSA